MGLTFTKPASTATAWATTPGRAEPVEPLDRALSSEGLYRWNRARVDTLRLHEIRQAVAHHIAANPRYRAYCASLGFAAEQLRTIQDLSAVPLLPSSLFKRRDLDLRTLAPDQAPDDVVATTSSGTQGSVSVVPRDDATLMRFFGSVSSAVRELLDVDDFTLPVFNLGPSPDEARHLWISYVLAGACVFFQSENYVRDGRLELTRLAGDLRAAQRDVLIVGPPALILELCEAMPAGGAGMDPRSLVISAGGWKRAGRTLDREAFRATCSRAFGIRPDRVRDAFNMVELNSVVLECEHHAKHVPPWVKVISRDPASLAPLGDRESGILSYLDPTALSYPGFVLSDDFGSVATAGRCACGRTTDVLSLERRINRVESRGCALKMNYASEGAPR